MRSMSMTGAQGRKTPVGDASGILGGGGMVMSGTTNAAAIAEQAASEDFNVTDSFNGEPATFSTNTPRCGTSFGGLIAQGFADLFGLFGSSGGGLTPNQIIMQHRLNRPHGGPHPLYTVFIGMAPVSSPEWADFIRFPPKAARHSRGLSLYTAVRRTRSSDAALPNPQARERKATAPP